MVAAVEPPLLDLASPNERWTRDFYGGDTTAMAELYRAHFDLVRAAVSTAVLGADAETVIHEVFLRLISNAELRRSYSGGAFGSWLYSVAKNHAIDYARRRGREKPDGLVPADASPVSRIDSQLEARQLLRRFREEILPAEWLSVFELRFLRQLDQRAAARCAGIPRTTLAYRELRIRRLLRSFLLAEEEEEADGAR